eukprot:6312597-Pyramimonas_sp.AAC.1
MTAHAATGPALRVCAPASFVCGCGGQAQCSGIDASMPCYAHAAPPIRRAPPPSSLETALNP